MLKLVGKSLKKSGIFAGFIKIKGEKIVNLPWRNSEDSILTKMSVLTSPSSKTNQHHVLLDMMH